MRRNALISAVALAVIVTGLPAGADIPEPTLMVIDHSAVLEADHYGSIRVLAPDVTLDCAGHRILGPGVLENPNQPPGEDNGYLPGVSVEGEGVTVKNCHAEGFEGSAFAVHVDRSTLIGNTASESGVGFGFQGNGHVIQGNTSVGSEVNAFLLQNGSGSLLKGNRAQGSLAAFSLELVNDVTLVGNTAVGDGTGEGIGFEVGGSSGNELQGNTATGYWGGFTIGLAEDFWTQELVSSNGNRLIGNEAVENRFPGFLAGVGRETVFEQNQASRNGGAGFVLWAEGFQPENPSMSRQFEEFWPSGVLFVKNKATRNGGSGFLIVGATGTRVEQNTSIRNSLNGGLSSGFSALVEDGTATVFTKNTACKNKVADAYDFSVVFPGLSYMLASWTSNSFCEPDASIPDQ